MNFDKWNEEFGGEEALADLKKAKENNQDFNELPDGTYTCKLEKLELAESKKGKPMVKGMFRITKGNFKKQCIFYNQVFTKGFPQHKCLEFLRSLDIFDKSEVDFDGDFNHFNDLLLDLAEQAESLEFDIEKSMDGEFTRLDCNGTYEG